ncbi:MAG: hypothetical protein EBU53_03835 [Proteobacteria bacterium]|nr:hypothetical protein [Pseudomonadota bacterium]NCA28887.1 hypothetical protein [Pseudomonadota bacterium]
MKNNLKIVGSVILFILALLYEILVLTIIFKFSMVHDEKITGDVVRLLAGFIPFVAGVQLSILGANIIDIKGLFKK